MKRLKNILYLMTICLVMVITGYFVFSFTQFKSGSKIAQETFKNTFYRTKDTKDFVSFGSFKNSVICVNDVYYFIDDVEYEKGIFTMNNKNNDDIYLIAVVEKDVLYSSSFNSYFYNIDLWEEK